MSHTMKIWERIIDRRLREETPIGDVQFGFMPGRGTTDAIFTVRNLWRNIGRNRNDCIAYALYGIYRPRKGVR